MKQELWLSAWENYGKRKYKYKTEEKAHRSPFCYPTVMVTNNWKAADSILRFSAKFSILRKWAYYDIRFFFKFSLGYLFFFFLIKTIGGAFLGSQQNWTEDNRDFPSIPRPHICIDSHIIPPPQWYICYSNWIYIDTPQSPKVQSLHYNSLLVLYIVQVWSNV